MYSYEIAHVLRHLQRMKAEVICKKVVAKPRSKKEENCKKFLSNLDRVYNVTHQFWINAGSLDISK